MGLGQNYCKCSYQRNAIALIMQPLKLKKQLYLQHISTEWLFIDDINVYIKAVKLKNQV